MALFINDSDTHVTIPDGCGGALIVPAGMVAIPGTDGPLIAVPPTRVEAIELDAALAAAVAEVEAGAPLVDLLVEVDALIAADGGRVEPAPTGAEDAPELVVPAVEPAADESAVTVSDVVEPDGLTPAAIDEVAPPKRRGGKG